MAPSFFAGGGQLGSLIRAFDWSHTSLGPISDWPQSLKTVTGMLLLSPVPIVLLWGPNGIMIYNDAYSVFAGERHPHLLGSEVRIGWAEVADFNDHVMRVGLAGGTLAYKDQELTLYRHGRPEPVWMNLDYSPVLDESGHPAGVIAIVVETTQSVLAHRKLRESEERFRALTTATSDVIYRMSADWRSMQQMDGRGFLADTAKPTVAWVDEYVYPEDQALVRATVAKALRDKKGLELEHRVQRLDGTVGWIASRAIPVMDADDTIREWFGTASDITERRRTEEHLRLAVNELNHRVKNTLAMTQAIAAQTFRNTGDLREAQERFSARMVALAQANDLLTGERWTGASLRGVIEQSVHPHCAEPARYSIEGPEFQLSPKTALALTLALHELATNAVKYGAWSGPDGSVAIRWERSGSRPDDRLRLEWRETDGPPVSRPARRGFGSRLVEQGLAGEMGATVRLDFEPAGLVCTVEARASACEEG